MKKKLRCAAAAWMTLLVLGVAISARAEFSPGFAALQNEGRMQAQISGQIEQAEPLSEASLTVVNDWLSKTKLTLAAKESESGQWTRIQADYEGSPFFAVSAWAEPEYHLTLFEQTDTAYMTSLEQQDALSLLTGSEDGLPRLDRIPAAYAQGAEALYTCLGEKTTGKRTKGSTSIRNATASAAYETYILQGDAMNAAWPEILDCIWPMLEPTLQEMPEKRGEVQSILSELVFSGECRFKRFLDKEDGDMGLQFTGNAALGEDKRKVTLFGGFTPNKGGYLSLSLPAVSGKNKMKLTVSWKETEKNGQHTLTLEADYTSTLNGESQTAAMDVSLKNTVKNETESWTGTVSLETGAADGKQQWQLKPTLTLDQTGLHGEISVQKKVESKTKLKATLSLTLTDWDAEMPTLNSANDLRGMDEPAALQILNQELQPLSQSLAHLMAALPEDSRTLLLHDLRTDAWMNAPTVGLDGSTPDLESEENDWIVEEEN